MSKEKSDFGKGFAYCLGLFLCHSGKRFVDMEREKEIRINLARLWLSEAANHLFEFDAENAPEPIRGRCLKLRENVVGRRLDHDVSWEEVTSYIQEAKAILLEYDKICGFETVKGDYE